MLYYVLFELRHEHMPASLSLVVCATSDEAELEVEAFVKSYGADRVGYRVFYGMEVARKP